MVAPTKQTRGFGVGMVVTTHDPMDHPSRVCFYSARDRLFDSSVSAWKRDSVLTRYWLEWAAPDMVLRAEEPTIEDVSAHASELAESYNHPHNRAMMSNTEAMSAQQVAETYADMLAAGGRPFLLFRDGQLLGDADFRHVQAGCAEFAIMVGPRALQGKGIGTRFAAMLHVWAFAVLGVSRLYVSIIPQNTASRRLFEKLGYLNDASAQSRSFAEAPDDICMSVDRQQLEAACAVVCPTIGQMRMGTHAARAG